VCDAAEGCVERAAPGPPCASCRPLKEREHRGGRSQRCEMSRGSLLPGSLRSRCRGSEGSAHELIVPPGLAAPVTVSTRGSAQVSRKRPAQGRLALANVLFNLIAASIALALFPVTIPLLLRASNAIAGVTLLAGYHAAYNIVGVAVVLPLFGRFTRFVERILPERASPLTRCLDPAALLTPLAAEEAVRRTVARSLGAVCGSIGAALTTTTQGTSIRAGTDAVSVTEASEALRAGAGIHIGGERPPRIGGRGRATHEHAACARPRVSSGRSRGGEGRLRVDAQRV